MTSVQSTSEPTRVQLVTGLTLEASKSIDAAIAEIEKASNVSSYMGRNSELMRQLAITRTQLQTAQLWLASAIGHVANATEGS